MVGPILVHVPLGSARGPALHGLREAADGRVEIRYSLGPKHAVAEIQIYDARGRELWTSAPEVHAPGEHLRTWLRLDRDGGRVPRGVYFVRLQAGGADAARKLVLVQP